MAASGGRAPIVRVALLGLPGMLGHIIAELLKNEPDVEVVANGPSALLPDIVSRLGVHVVVLGLPGDGEQRAERDLLRSVSGAATVAVNPDGTRAIACPAWPTVVELGELSPQQLIAEVRSAAVQSNRKGRQ